MLIAGILDGHEGARNILTVLDLASAFQNLSASSRPTTAADLSAVARYAEELVKIPKVKGFKFHPPDQGF